MPKPISQHRRDLMVRLGKFIEEQVRRDGVLVEGRFCLLLFDRDGLETIENCSDRDLALAAARFIVRAGGAGREDDIESERLEQTAEGKPH